MYKISIEFYIYIYYIYYRMNHFIDVCKLLGNYNDKDVFFIYEL